MTLNKNDKLYRFAYATEFDRDKPRQVSLCKFFWRVVLIAPLQYLFIGAVLAIFGLPMIFIEYVWEPYVLVPYREWEHKRWEAKRERLHQEWKDRQNGIQREPTSSGPTFIDLISAWFSAKKARFCPTIKVEGYDDQW